jgi:hypothetical protein
MEAEPCADTSFHDLGIKFEGCFRSHGGFVLLDRPPFFSTRAKSTSKRRPAETIDADFSRSTCLFMAFLSAAVNRRAIYGTET